MCTACIYGAIAGFSVNFVIVLLIREIFWIRLFGGILLIGIGVTYLRRPSRPPQALEGGKDGAHHSDLT